MSIERVSILSKIMVDQELRVAILNEELSNAKAALLRTKREDLPALFSELGLAEIRLDTGEKIVVKNDCECSISAANKEEAFRWLIDNGFGGLIKTIVSVEFGRGDIEAAQLLADRLKEEELPAQAVETVHASTLKAFINEQLAAAQPIPFELFGVFPFTYATLSKK